MCGSMCPADRECSRCPTGGTCAVETYACRCPFFDRIRYNFDVSHYDWSNVNGVSITVTHVAVDGTPQPSRMIYLNRSQLTESVSRIGCEADVIIRRRHSVAGGRTCELEERITGVTDFVLPMPEILMDGSCVVPSLTGM